MFTIKKLKQIPYDRAKAMLDKAEQAEREARCEKDAANREIVEKEVGLTLARLVKEFEEHKMEFISNPCAATRFFHFYVKRPQTFDTETGRIPSKFLIVRLNMELRKQLGHVVLRWDPVNLQHSFKIYVTARSEEEIAADVEIQKDKAASRDFADHALEFGRARAEKAKDDACKAQ